ncbi:chromosome partitioning protein Soj [Marinibactrum halimedae]|uniref:Chromosome partitioning protein Soj n=2 Tax=Marinibactrum halimedae TaxID=1444977 RepID=A0AA37WP88_9GAMM|nr:chromosome partitioning protein Soj [Marinibactrum halimedae]
MIDLDPQGNATMGAGVDKNDVEHTIYDVLVGNCNAEQALSPSSAGFDLLPANGDLTAAEVELLDIANKEQRLRKSLSKIRDQYDFILIDCPPSLNMLTVNALTACDGVIIPMQCEYYALEGLSALVNTVNQIQKLLNPALQIEGILRTMYDPRNSLTNDVSAQLSDYFGERLYRTCIPRNVRLAEAPSYGLPVLSYDKQSKGAIAYLALAKEVLKRHALEEKQTIEA